MNKKALVIAIVSVAATVAVVGASVGLTMKLQARPDFDYRERIAANKDVEINGEKMYYLAPDSSEYQDENYYREAIYKDDKGFLYSFDADTQELCHIKNTDLPDKDYTGVMAEDMKPYNDTETLLADAEKLIDKWCDKDTKSKLEFEAVGQQWDTSIDIYQNINDEVRFWIGSVTYNEDGIFTAANFRFDSMLDSNDIANMLSEEAAVKAVKVYLEENYEETGWEEIRTAVGVCGEFGNCWAVTCLRYDSFNNGEDHMVFGYLVAVDILTGEIKFVDRMK